MTSVTNRFRISTRSSYYLSYTPPFDDEYQMSLSLSSIALMSRFRASAIAAALHFGRNSSLSAFRLVFSSSFTSLRKPYPLLESLIPT